VASTIAVVASAIVQTFLSAMDAFSLFIRRTGARTIQNASPEARV
jgi:hypothetical protein